jgi:hypothetical protein
MYLYALHDMKKIYRLFFIVLICASCELFADGARFTADYYKADPDKFLGKEVKVYFAKVEPQNYVHHDGYVSYWGYSYYDGVSGGYSYIYVPVAQSAKLYKQLGSDYVYGNNYEVESKAIKAHMIRVGDQICFVYGGGPMVDNYLKNKEKSDEPKDVSAE